MTLSNSASNNGPPQQSKGPARKFEFQTEATLSSAQLSEIWARRAYALAEEPPAEAIGQTVDLLLFWLGNERYGLEVTSVREIHPLQQVTPVPRVPDFVVGVFSARGRILSIVDLQAFFGLRTAPFSPHGYAGPADETKIIVVANTDPTSKTTQVELGLLADTVDDVITVFKEDIEPPLITHGGVQAEYLQGITADMLAVIDLNTLLNDKQLIIQEELI